MAIMIDSTPVFLARLKQFGIESLWPTFQEKGWTTWGDYAFSSAWQPGVVDDSSFIAAVTKPLLGEPPAVPADGTEEAKKVASESLGIYNSKMIKLKRLFVEAYTLYAADMQRKVIRTDDDDRPRKLAKEERADRLDKVKHDLELLELGDEPELIPSHKLVDTLTAMTESGELRPIPWEDLTTREQERRGAKKDPSWGLDKQGRLALMVTEDGLAADTSNEARTRFTLQRRGVALQMSRLGSFRVHQKLIKFLMREYTREQPPDFQAVSLNQVYTADKEIFLLLSEWTEGGLDPATSGNYPLDKHILKAIEEPRIKAFLNPYPRISGGGKRKDYDGSGNQSAEIKRLREENRRLSSSHQKTAKAPKGASKGGKTKKGGKQQKNSSTKAPAELQGLSARLPAGKRFCYAFNLEGCSHSSNCPKGEHACMKCGSTAHGARDHV